MDRKVVVAMLVSVAFLMLYSTLMGQYAPTPEPVAADGAGAVQGTTGAPTTVPGAGEGLPPVLPALVPQDPAAPAVPAVPDAPEETVTLDSGRLSLTASTLGGALNSVTAHACEYHGQNGDAAGAAAGDPGRTSERPAGRPGLLSLDVVVAGARLGLHDRTWEVTQQGGELIARTRLPEHGLEIEKHIRPSTDDAAPYHADVEIVFRGIGTEAPRPALVEVVGPWLAETKTPRPEDALVVAVVGDDVDDLTPGSVADMLEDDAAYARAAPDGVAYIGARADFHLGALIPDGARRSEVRFLAAEHPVGISQVDEVKVGEEAETWKTAAAVVIENVTLPAAGDTTTLRYRYFAGPNSRPLFAEDGSPYASLADAVPKRTFIVSFGPIERVLAWLLRLIAGLGIGYGWAVVVLTIMVRGMMFPLSRKSQVSMRIHGKKMALLKPKMSAIKEKYKDSRKQQEMTMKLMREEKVSILPGGCLLAFVQMPIWIALYGILQTTFAMRHASFFWAGDLTAPDRLLAIPFAADWPVLNGWLNLFPILMMITWGISAHMTPLPDEPQQRQQAKMMRWMPMLFGVFLYGFASGLTLYMTMSALWSIGEVQLIRRLWLKKIDAQYEARLAAIAK